MRIRVADAKATDVKTSITRRSALTEALYVAASMSPLLIRVDTRRNVTYLPRKFISHAWKRRLLPEVSELYHKVGLVFEGMVLC